MNLQKLDATGSSHCADCAENETESQNQPTTYVGAQEKNVIGVIFISWLADVRLSSRNTFRWSSRISVCDVGPLFQSQDQRYHDSLAMVIFCVGHLKNAHVASLMFLVSDQIWKMTKFTFSFFLQDFQKFAKMGFTSNGNTAG